MKPLALFLGGIIGGAVVAFVSLLLTIRRLPVEVEVEEKAKLLGPKELLTLWIHQNTLLWGRLQTATAVQVPLFAAWWFLAMKCPPTPSTFVATSAVAVLGLLLMTALMNLVRLDLSYRRVVRMKIDASKKAMPKPEWSDATGHFTVMVVMWLLVVVDFLLVVATVIWMSHSVGRVPNMS